MAETGRSADAVLYQLGFSVSVGSDVYVVIFFTENVFASVLSRPDGEVRDTQLPDDPV